MANGAPHPDAAGKRKLKIGKWTLPLPQSPLIRVIVGVLLILGGLGGFLPVLGFWMVPVGLLVLSVDLPFVRRWRRRLQVWWERRRRNGEGNGSQPASRPERK